MLGSTIRKELMQIIMRELDDPRLTGMPSITRVLVTKDLEYADVFVTVMGTPGQQTAALNALKHSAGMMRAMLTRLLSIRQAPFLRFQIDEGLKKELAVLDLLEKARQESEELDRRRAEAAAGAGEDPAAASVDGDDPAAPRQPASDRAATDDHPE
jgi:ribosome-binding factor A